MTKFSGVNVPHLKNASACKPERMATPKKVTIPMSMHIGTPAKPVVSVGDAVKVGQLIAVANGFVSCPIHASVSGKVKSIDDMLMSNGQTSKAIIIEADGEQEVCEEITPPQVHDFDSFIAAVRASGLVGLGGAGFPTAVKLFVKELSKIEAIIVNGAECEPYVTSDTRTMLDDAELVVQGAKLLQKYLETERVIIAIENNKSECIKKFRELTKDVPGVTVTPLPSMYPQGGEKVLIYNTIGHIVPEGKLPIDAGVIVINCTTLAFIAKYINTGMPLVEKTVTVDGSAVKTPKNVIAPIGTLIVELFDYCGGFKSEPGKVFYGGPMMGIAVPDLSVPVMKNTNAVVALNRKDAILPETTSCIRCGSCIDHCPMKLMPVEIENAYELKKPEELEKLKVNLCMECGCCAYICPARRPLVQVNKLAKAMLRRYQAERKAEKEKQENRGKKEAVSK